MKKIVVIVTLVLVGITNLVAQDCYTGWTSNLPDAGKGVYLTNVGNMNIYRSVCSTTYVPVNGSAIVDGKIRGIYHYMSGMIFHIIIDPITGLCDYGEVVQDGYSMCALCTAQDQTTGEVWGQFYNDKGTTDFGKVDYTTWTRTTIKSGIYHIYSVMGVSSDGYVYGITTDNKVYQIDKEDGRELYIGKTGVTPNTNLPQAGEIYQKTNTFYYTAYDKNISQNALFTINLNTGAATKIASAPAGLSFMLFLPQEVDDKAPAASTDFSVAFEGASLNGKATFTAPLKAFDGSLLSTSERLTYILYVDSNEVVRGQCDTGDKKTVDVSCEGSRQHEFMLRFENTVGLGDKAVVNEWVGYDIPATTTMNIVRDDGNSIHFAWNEVSNIGKNGKVVDPTDVTYSLYATDGESLKMLLYTGKNKEFDFPCETGTDEQDYLQVALVVTNEAGMSDKTFAGLVVGEALPMPYEEHFTGLDGFTHLVIPVTSGWYIDQDYETDGDGQSICWMTNQPLEGELSLGKITLKNNKNPKYSFDYRVTPGDDLTITVAIRLKSGELKNFETIKVAEMTKAEAKWITANYDLSEYMEEEYIIPEFFLITNNTDSEYNVAVNFDNALIAGDYDPTVEPVYSATYQQENGGVRLRWQAEDGTPRLVTETFESAEAWTYSPEQTIEGFKVLTQDEGVFCKVFTSETIGFEGYPGSFFVWNGTDHNDGTTSFNGHSGVQSLATVNKANALLTEFIPSDNWVVSPKLPGVEQTITLWGRNRNGQETQPEQLEFYYSTTDTEITSFVKISEATLIRGEWEKLSFQIPTGAKYFAIRQISENGFLLLLDDISYLTSIEAPVSFNIYRNEDFIVNVTEKTYFVSSASTSEKFEISAVYADGRESLPVIATDYAGIDVLNANSDKYTKGVMYDVMGRRITYPYKGLVISKGKKWLK